MSRFAELADGRRLEFPDETTDEVIQATVKRHLSTVTAEPAQEPGIVERTRLAFTGEQQMTPEIEKLEEVQRSPEFNQLTAQGFKIAYGLLSTTDPEEQKSILTSQLGDDVKFTKDAKGNDIVNLPSGQFALNMPGMSTRDIMPAIMDVLAFTPAGKAATIPAAIAKSAGTEALLEAGEAGVGGQFDTGDVMLAGGLGGFFKGAENLIGAGFRAAKGALTGSGADVVEAGADTGINVLTSDIKQPQTFVGKTAQQTGEKIPIAGTGAVREVQQMQRVQAVADVAEKYGQFSYGAIIDSLKAKTGTVKRAAGAVLENVGNKLDVVGNIPIDNTLTAAKEVQKELGKPGVITSGSAIDDLNTLLQALKTSQTFTTLKENRTAFQEIIKGADKAERSQLTSRAKSLLQKVSNGLTNDMKAFAKDNLTPAEFGKWQKANSVYAEEAKNLTKSGLKTVLDKGDITPESVGKLLFSQNPSEVKLLYKNLTPDGRQNARSAVISKVVDNLSRRQAGLTPNAFASEMNKMGLQVGVFFKGEEKKQLNGLLKVLDATRRAQDAAVTTPTGQQLLGAGTLAAAATDLYATLSIGGTVGGLARLYESAPVRNALLRLGSIPKGSTRFEQALSEAVAILQSGTQSAREQISDR